MKNGVPPSQQKKKKTLLDRTVECGGKRAATPIAHSNAANRRPASRYREERPSPQARRDRRTAPQVENRSGYP